MVLIVQVQKTVDLVTLNSYLNMQTNDYTLHKLAVT